MEKRKRKRGSVRDRKPNWISTKYENIWILFCWIAIHFSRKQIQFATIFCSFYSLHNFCPLFNGAKPGPFSLLCLFSSFSQHNDKCSTKFDHINGRRCGWDSNPGPQYGSRRRVHWAMAATFCLFFRSLLLRQIFVHLPNEWTNINVPK